MHDRIEQLSAEWKDNPSLERTLALLQLLRGPLHAGLIQTVGEYAKETYSNDLRVLLAVARTFLSAHRFSDAQTLLVSAGKIAPRDGTVYRVLGEVLLRRGDADRAEKVFERAMQFGVQDADTKMWFERAKVYKSVQARSGAQVVAAEVERSNPAGLEIASGPAVSDEITRIATPTERAKIRTDLPAPPVSAPELGMPPRRSSAMPPPLPMETERDLAALISELGPPPLPGATSHAPTAPSETLSRTEELLSLPKPSPPIVAGGTILGVAPPRRTEESITFNLDDPPPGMPSEPSLWNETAGHYVPEPREILDALAAAGIYEPNADPTPFEWYRPKAKKSLKGSIALGLVIGVLVGSGLLVHRQVNLGRARAAEEAAQILEGIDRDLLLARGPELTPMEARFSRVFDLDSRSPRAALLWLRQKTMVGYLTHEEPKSIEQAMKRVAETRPFVQGESPAKRDEETLKVVAFAQLASFLFHGDTAGAVELLPKFDASAGTDAWYQFFAGASLERAGDLRAEERYLTATRLAPNFIAAHIALTRIIALEGDPKRAAELGNDFRSRFPDRAEAAAILGLAWARNPLRSESPPPEIDEVLRRANELPESLAVVPFAIRAIRSLDKRDFETARSEVKAGLAHADSPGVAAWLGGIAIAADDQVLARQAALAAVSFSAVFPPARVLAARVALLANRLDEAVKATEGLDPVQPDVAMVRASIAYERVDPELLEKILSAARPELQKLPLASPLLGSPEVLSGHSKWTQAQLKPSELDIPGSDLIWMDLALDRANLDLSNIIATRWKGHEERPLRAIRLSRLARLENRIEDADKYSALAMQAPSFRSVAERGLVLIARGKHHDVASLLKRYPLALGPFTPWMEAYALASGGGKMEEARAKVSSLDPPAPTAPLLGRLLAAGALGALKDTRRGFPVIREIVDQGIGGPEISSAAALFGMKTFTRK